MSLLWQSLIFMMALNILRKLLDTLELLGITHKMGRGFGLYDLIYLPILLTSSFVGLGFGAVLGKLHRFFDEDGYLNSDKQYLDGNLAWGHVFFGVVCLICAITLRTHEFAPYLVSAGFFGFAPNAYRWFAVRRRGSGRRKKQPISERLKKLIEASRSWLPKPAPIPS